MTCRSHLKRLLMSFITDKQTLDDLNIFGRHDRGNSVYAIFNRTFTRGGGKLLEDMFALPLADKGSISRRSSIIQMFLERGTAFPFTASLLEDIDHYLGNTDSRSRLASDGNNLNRRIKKLLGADREYSGIRKGVQAMLELLHGTDYFVRNMKETASQTYYAEDIAAMEKILAVPEILETLIGKVNRKLPYERLAQYDRLFRFRLRDSIQKLLWHIYNLDVYISVASVAAARNFVFAQALDPSENRLIIDDVYHPCINKPVANSIRIGEDNNVIFLTGANMGGKSTFMKTFGIAVFLAHMGFPVPASRMEFSVRNGMFTTINLPDNLSMGYSHFYAEVMRVKKVAEQVTRTGNLIVIFDELFRGTNVKDAFDATVAITGAFSSNRACIFIISTHIIEAGNVLGDRYHNIGFLYLPTIMGGNTPVYTYKLTEGITTDRHGMIIINNERILEIINSREL